MQRAKLDHDGVYWGPEEVGEGKELADGDIAVPDECIRPGAYRWDAEQKCWVALAPGQVKKAEGAPSFEQAFYDFAQASEAALPVRTAAWCAAFKKTLDGSGA